MSIFFFYELILDIIIVKTIHINSITDILLL